MDSSRPLFVGLQHCIAHAHHDVISCPFVSFTPFNPPRHFFLSPGSYGDTVAWVPVSALQKKNAISVPPYNDFDFEDHL